MPTFILTLILTAVAEYFLPYWWLAAVVPFLVALGTARKGGVAFAAGFAAVFLLWLGLAAYINYMNEGILAARMEVMLKPMLMGTPIYLFGALVGGLVAGLSALSGFLLRRAIGR